MPDIGIRSSLLELHREQVNRVASKTKANKYADNRKDGFHKNLFDLIDKINQADINALDDNERIKLKDVLVFVHNSIEYLDSSTYNLIPYEIVYCLESAMQDWLGDEYDEYIIVTSLSNKIYSYSFDYNSKINTLYQGIQKTYNITFTYKLVQITLPKYTAHDYLSNVVLYHELGHFIDFKYRISASIIAQEFNLKYSPNDCFIYEKHFSEYFADIFACQYIGKSSNYYLSYIAHGVGDYPTHPATLKRVNAVNDFQSQSPHFFVDKLKIATETITGKKLEQRHEDISDSDFFNLLPPEPSNVKQVHALFESGWNIWIEKRDKMSTENEANFSDGQCYKIINNLIEKSISNFVVTNQWKENNVSGQE